MNNNNNNEHNIQIMQKISKNKSNTELIWIIQIFIIVLFIFNNISPININPLLSLILLLCIYLLLPVLSLVFSIDTKSKKYIITSIIISILLWVSIFIFNPDNLLDILGLPDNFG